MISSVGAVPVGIFLGDEVHGGLKVAADAVDVVWLLGDQIAGGIYRDVEEVGVERVEGADGGVEKQVVNVHLA